MAEKFTTKRPRSADEDGGRREQARDAELLESAEQTQVDDVGPRQQSDPTEDQPDLNLDPARTYRGDTAEDQVDEATSEFDSPDDLVDDGTGKEEEATVHNPTEAPDLVPDSATAKSDLLGSAEVLTDPLRDALDPTGQPDPTRGADLASDDNNDHDANLERLRASVAEYKADVDELAAEYGVNSGGDGDADGSGSPGSAGGGDTYVMERGGSLKDKMSDEGVEGLVKKGLDWLGGGNNIEPVYRNTRTGELVDEKHLPKDATVVDGRSQLGEQEEHPDNDTGTAPEEGRTLWGDISRWFSGDDDEVEKAPAPESGDGDASDPSLSDADPPPPESSDGEQLVELEGMEQLSPFWQDDVEFGPSAGEEFDKQDRPTEYIGEGGDTGADTGMARPGGESAPDDPIVKAHLEEERQKMLDLLGYDRRPPRSGTIDPTETDAGEAEGGQIAPPGVDDPPEDEEQPQGEPEGEVPMGQPGAIDPSEEDDIGARTGIEEDVPGEDDLYDDGSTLDLDGDGSTPPLEPPTMTEVDQEELADRLADDGIDPGEVFPG